MIRLLLFVAAMSAAGLGKSAVAQAQEKKDDKAASRVTALLPLAVAGGTTSKVRLTGFKLDAATEVKVVGPDAVKDRVKVSIKGKGKAEAKGDKAKAAGDTQIDVEVALPTEEGEAVDRVTLVVVTPDGPTPERSVRVVDQAVLVDEKEPNGGLQTAQAVMANPAVVRGAIGEEKDVDVYKAAGKAGQTLRAEVFADRAGSALDASLTLLDARGRTLAFADDTAGKRDPVLEWKLPADGDYFVAVIDANDRGGGSAFPYLLELSVK